MKLALHNTYSASFTAGSLLFEEFNAILDIILKGNIENKKTEIINTNILKINSESSRKRVYSELKKRVKSVPRGIWDLYNDSNDLEKKTVLFYVVLKAHMLLLDFQTEIILSKYRSLNLDTDKNDIDIFLAKKSGNHPEIEQWSDLTRGKIKNTILLILRQAGIIKNNQITPISLSIQFWKKFIEVGDVWFLEVCLLNKNERDQILGIL